MNRNNKRCLILSLFLLFAFALQSWEIVDANGKSRQINETSFSKLPLVEVHTEREKKGKRYDDHWKGFLLADWLKQEGLSHFQEAVFESADHYQVRINQGDTEKPDVIIALYRNGEKLPPEEIRLVMPDKRDMYWIAGISKITFQAQAVLLLPNTIYWGEKILARHTLQTDVEPFKGMQGYPFHDLLDPAIPFPDGEVLVMGNDGVKQLLDYRKYLAHAVLDMTTEKGMWLKSPDMPGGMWVKNLAYLQFGKTAILFLNSMSDKSLADVAQMLNWQPALVQIPDSGEIKTPKQWELADVKLSDHSFTHTGYILLKAK